MNHYSVQAAQNASSDLLAVSLDVAWVYLNSRAERIPVPRYIGPDTPKNHALTAREKQLLQGIESPFLVNATILIPQKARN